MLFSQFCLFCILSNCIVHFEHDNIASFFSVAGLLACSWMWYNILTVLHWWSVTSTTSCWLRKNQQKKTDESSRRTYSLCKGRILVSWCRGTQWGQSWLLEEVQTRRRPCNRHSAQSESWTDHTLSLKTWCSEVSSVCPHQPCNSLMTGRFFITHRHDWWMQTTQKMSTDNKKKN